MKKILSSMMLLSMFSMMPVTFAQNANITSHQESMFKEKKATSSSVMVSDSQNVLCAGNALRVKFCEKFKSECAKAGDNVNFQIEDAIYTEQGTLIIPAGSILCAKVLKIEKQHFPNKNARVYMGFETLTTPDGISYPINATVAKKNGILKEGPWNTTGKIVLYTLGLGAIGAGAGVGLSFIATPAKIGTGLAAGIPTGCGIGLLLGLLTPGLKYHAKAGEEIVIILNENLAICSQCNK